MISSLLGLKPDKGTDVGSASLTFEEYSKKFLFFHNDNLPTLLVKNLPEKSFSLADLGAGDGVCLLSLLKAGHLKNANKIVAVDLSEDRCQRLSAVKELSVICSDVINVAQIPDSSLDFVISTQVIEHVDEDKFLEEIFRILKPGGKLFIASLISKYGNDRFYMLKYGWRYGWRFYQAVPGKWFVDPTHLREYESQEHFLRVVSNGGFKVLNSHTERLRLSFMEFVVRRIIVPLFRPAEPNKIFSKYPMLNFLRTKIQIQPPGYFLVEALAEKPSDLHNN